MLLVAGASELEVGRADAQGGEAQGSRASTLRGDTAGKQLRGGKARARRCPLCGRRDRGARDPDHCSEPYPTNFVVLRNSPKF
jgi:hypothetical protein